MHTKGPDPRPEDGLGGAHNCRRNADSSPEHQRRPTTGPNTPRAQFLLGSNLNPSHMTFRTKQPPSCLPEARSIFKSVGLSQRVPNLGRSTASLSVRHLIKVTISIRIRVLDTMIYAFSLLTSFFYLNATFLAGWTVRARTWCF